MSPAATAHAADEPRPVVPTTSQPQPPESSAVGTALGTHFAPSQKGTHRSQTAAHLAGTAAHPTWRPYRR